MNLVLLEPHEVEAATGRVVLDDHRAVHLREVLRVARRLYRRGHAQLEAK